MENILKDQQHNYVLCDFGSATTQVHLKDDPKRNIRQLEDDYNKYVLYVIYKSRLNHM